MYDRNGKKVLEGRIEPGTFAKVSVTAAGATGAGGILAGGGGTMTEGAVMGFIAKTDSAGRTTQAVNTGRYSPYQVCEAADGSVWTLGYDREYRDAPDAGYEKGLLSSFLSLDSISKSPDAILQLDSPRKSFLRCSRGRVSVLFWSAGQYIEVDAPNEKLTWWVVQPSSLVGGEATGFAVTEDQRIFLSLRGFGAKDRNVTRGLFELKANPGILAVTLTPVGGALTTVDLNSMPADETFDRLWGADGNELVVHRIGDGWGISWAKVCISAAIPD
jgi:hypothetical protein